MFQTKVVQKIKKYILRSIIFFFSKTCPLSDNVEKHLEQVRPQMTTWRVRTAWWIPMSTNTHSKYVIIIAFQLQKWLKEHPSMLSYTYIGRLVQSDIR